MHVHGYVATFRSMQPHLWRCNYIRTYVPLQVSFLGSLTNAREMAQVFIGAFYGIPLFPVNQAPSLDQLQSLEERLLSQYYLHRDNLSSALLSYASLQGSALSSQQYEEKVDVEYHQCFKMQVSLARLRNFMRKMRECEVKGVKGGVYGLADEPSTGYGRYSISKLSKLIGCLVDTLLALNAADAKSAAVDMLAPPPPRAKEASSPYSRLELGVAGFAASSSPSQSPSPFFGHVHSLSEEDCRVLFHTLCIHGIPKMHARAIALLIKYGGGQGWWGGFIVKVATELFGAQQTEVFNKERWVWQIRNYVPLDYY